MRKVFDLPPHLWRTRKDRRSVPIPSILFSMTLVSISTARSTCAVARTSITRSLVTRRRSEGGYRYRIPEPEGIIIITEGGIPEGGILECTRGQRVREWNGTPDGIS